MRPARITISADMGPMTSVDRVTIDVPVEVLHAVGGEAFVRGIADHIQGVILHYKRMKVIDRRYDPTTGGWM